jgi:hypothetical protein
LSSPIKTPPSKETSLFDHLAGKREQIVGNIDAERAAAVLRLITSSNLVGCTDREIGELGTFENAGGVNPVLAPRAIIRT